MALVLHLSKRCGDSLGERVTDTGKSSDLIGPCLLQPLEPAEVGQQRLPATRSHTADLLQR